MGLQRETDKKLVAECYQYHHVPRETTLLVLVRRPASARRRAPPRLLGSLLHRSRPPPPPALLVCFFAARSARLAISFSYLNRARSSCTHSGWVVVATAVVVK